VTAVQHKAERVWRGCAIPRDLLYDVVANVWVRLEDDVAVLGMTDVAQTMGGRIVQVSWKRTGRSYRRGRSLAIIESAKWVGPFPAPLSGELVEVNDRGFAADVAIANRDPYGAGWLARLRPADLAAERGHLLTGDEAFGYYRAFIEERDLRCYRCAD
jgi:glycine cleavage system H protein